MYPAFSQYKMKYYIRIADYHIALETNIKIEFRHPYSIFFEGEDLSRKEDILYRIETCRTPPLTAEEIRPMYGNPAYAEDDRFRWKIYYWAYDGKHRDIFFRQKKDDDSKYTLFVPEDQKNEFLTYGNWLANMGLEHVFVYHKVIMLHSSVVDWNGQGILFTAPSGTGKSTQAELWAKYEGARVLNGDRTLIRKKDGVYTGYGSPFAGSSGIYCNDGVPIRAIVVLQQGRQNEIRRMRPGEAAVKLLGQCIQNFRSRDYTERLFHLAEELAGEIPVYHLVCRPDQGAVDTVKKVL